MNQEYTAIVKEDGDWWIGWIEEVPGINCQEATHEDLIKSLKITLKEALEFNRQDAMQAAVSNYSESMCQMTMPRYKQLCVASAGDTIIVYPGTYTENVDVHPVRCSCLVLIYRDGMLSNGVNKGVTIKSENWAEATIVQMANPSSFTF